MTSKATTLRAHGMRIVRNDRQNKTLIIISISTSISIIIIIIIISILIIIIIIISYNRSFTDL